MDGFVAQGRVNSWPRSWIQKLETRKRNEQIVTQMQVATCYLTEKLYPIWFRLVQDRLHAWCARLPLHFCINCTKTRLSLFWAKTFFQGQEIPLHHLGQHHWSIKKVSLFYFSYYRQQRAHPREKISLKSNSLRQSLLKINAFVRKTFSLVRKINHVYRQ